MSHDAMSHDDLVKDGSSNACRAITIGGAGTNLKVGNTLRAGNFLFLPLHFFGSTSTTSRFGERFRNGQHSLVSFLFAVLLLTVPPCPAICKSGGICLMKFTPLITIQHLRYELGQNYNANGMQYILQGKNKNLRLNHYRIVNESH